MPLDLEKNNALFQVAFLALLVDVSFVCIFVLLNQ